MGDLPWERAAARVDFRLNYTRLDKPRECSPDAIYGPSIPDAFGEGTAAGEWYAGDCLEVEDLDTSEADWLAHFAQMAVNEAIHEALEWFQVDGKPWLDPHGVHENRIYRLTEKLTEGFAALVAEGDSAALGVQEGDRDG